MWNMQLMSRLHRPVFSTGHSKFIMSAPIMTLHLRTLFYCSILFYIMITSESTGSSDDSILRL